MGSATSLSRCKMRHCGEHENKQVQFRRGLPMPEKALLTGSRAGTRSGARCYNRGNHGARARGRSARPPVVSGWSRAEVPTTCCSKWTPTLSRSSRAVTKSREGSPSPLPVRRVPFAFLPTPPSVLGFPHSLSDPVDMPVAVAGFSRPL